MGAGVGLMMLTGVIMFGFYLYTKQYRELAIQSVKDLKLFRLASDDTNKELGSSMDFSGVGFWQENDSTLAF
ncbi:hypothetical protein evm_006168 [Chilo suppressalis]|nr:hypothetical protein evm_006168 [Chilo suppressalis]